MDGYVIVLAGVVLGIIKIKVFYLQRRIQGEQAAPPPPPPYIRPKKKNSENVGVHYKFGAINHNFTCTVLNNSVGNLY